MFEPYYSPVLCVYFVLVLPATYNPPSAQPPTTTQTSPGDALISVSGTGGGTDDGGQEGAIAGAVIVVIIILVVVALSLAFFMIFWFVHCKNG